MHAPHRGLARASAGAAVVTLIAACGGQGDEQSALPDACSDQQDESSSQSSSHLPQTDPTAGSSSPHNQRTDSSGEQSLPSKDVVADIEDGLDYQRENGITYTGEITGTVTVERVSEFDARVVACHDNSEVALQVEGEGEQPVKPREDGAEVAELVFELSKPQGVPFQVTSHQEGNPC